MARQLQPQRPIPALTTSAEQEVCALHKGARELARVAWLYYEEEFHRDPEVRSPNYDSLVAALTAAGVISPLPASVPVEEYERRAVAAGVCPACRGGENSGLAVGDDARV